MRGNLTKGRIKYYKDCPAEATTISQICSRNSDCGTTNGLVAEQINARGLMNVARSVLIRGAARLRPVLLRCDQGPEKIASVRFTPRDWISAPRSESRAPLLP